MALINCPECNKKISDKAISCPNCGLPHSQIELISINQMNEIDDDSDLVKSTDLRCPKCGSNQITAVKKGFSGKKAVGGAILTGGIGLLAGTIGSNKVKITCLACGEEFKPGEGKTTIIPDVQTSTTISSGSTTSLLDSVDQRIIEMCEQQDLLSAVKFCEEAKGVDFKTAQDYVTNLIIANGVKFKKGCFVATACYDDYDSPQVLVLRKFRDERLLKTFLGTIFVKFYYSVSPFFAELIAKSHLLKRIIRKCFLDPIVAILQEQSSYKTRE